MESLKCIFTQIAIIFKHDLRLSKCQSWCSATAGENGFCDLSHTFQRFHSRFCDSSVGNFNDVPLEPCTDSASHLLAINLPLDVRIACNGLQQKFHHFTSDPLISQPILIQSSHIFHH